MTPLKHFCNSSSKQPIHSGTRHTVGIFIQTQFNVLVEHRLGRNVDDVLANVQLCKEHHLNVYYQKEQLSIFNSDGKEHPFLTIFIAVLGTCAEMERENIMYRLNSGKEKYIAEGGKVGRKAGWTKTDEKLQEQYASVIKQLKKGYPIRLVAKSEGVGVSTVQRMKKKFVDDVA